MQFTEFSGWGGAANNGTEQPRFSIKDDFSLIPGAHSIKISALPYDRQQANGFGQQQIAGSVTLDFRNTSVPGATTQTSGSSFASFLLGTAYTGATETISICSRSIHTTPCMRRTTGASTRR